MIATFTALLFAHVLADFILQTNNMYKNKAQPGMLLLHGVVVLITAQVATGQFTSLWLIALAVAHLAIDAIKTYLWNDRLAAFLTDQAAHLVTLAVIAWLAPSLWETGLWTGILPAPWSILALHAMLMAAGLIIALPAGSFAVQKLIELHDDMETGADQGLPGGGETIGQLERLMIVLLVFSGDFSAIGFLVAAKSILRFSTVSGDRKATEYVLIGTLASFGWDILAAKAISALSTMLPALEIGQLIA